eukprot:GILJ01008867.1.p1 GENE.GILJ01008867.1~~GILJ01008867.1.p1  ORF type:complete len:1341 (-),score=190.62 GILJ01008867.1:196-4161(-)
MEKPRRHTRSKTAKERLLSLWLRDSTRTPDSSALPSEASKISLYQDGHNDSLGETREKNYAEATACIHPKLGQTWKRADSIEPFSLWTQFECLLWGDCIVVFNQSSKLQRTSSFGFKTQALPNRRMRRDDVSFCIPLRRCTVEELPHSVANAPFGLSIRTLGGACYLISMLSEAVHRSWMSYIRRAADSYSTKTKGSSAPTACRFAELSTSSMDFNLVHLADFVVDSWKTASFLAFCSSLPLETNCAANFLFLLELEQYRLLSSENLPPQARKLHEKFIDRVSAFKVQVPDSVVESIERCLAEGSIGSDLFDEAELYVFVFLQTTAYAPFLCSDLYKGMLDELGSALTLVPIEQVLMHSQLSKYFQLFLMREQKQQPLTFWLDIERQYKTSFSVLERQTIALEMYKKYIRPGAALEVRLTVASRRALEDILFDPKHKDPEQSLELFSDSLFDSIQHELFRLLKIESYPKFRKSTLYPLMLEEVNLNSQLQTSFMQTRPQHRASAILRKASYMEVANTLIRIGRPGREMSLSSPLLIHDRFIDFSLLLGCEVNWGSMSCQPIIENRYPLSEEPSTVLPANITAVLQPSRGLLVKRKSHPPPELISFSVDKPGGGYYHGCCNIFYERLTPSHPKYQDFRKLIDLNPKLVQIDYSRDLSSASTFSASASSSSFDAMLSSSSSPSKLYTPRNTNGTRNSLLSVLSLSSASMFVSNTHDWPVYVAKAIVTLTRWALHTTLREVLHEACLSISSVGQETPMISRLSTAEFAEVGDECVLLPVQALAKTETDNDSDSDQDQQQPAVASPNGSAVYQPVESAVEQDVQTRSKSSSIHSLVTQRLDLSSAVDPLSMFVMEKQKGESAQTVELDANGATGAEQIVAAAANNHSALLKEIYFLPLPSVFSSPLSLSLPAADFSMRYLVKALDVKSLLRIFSLLLLEKSIIFMSSSATLPLLVIQGLISLLFPFSWQHRVHTLASSAHHLIWLLGSTHHIANVSADNLLMQEEVLSGPFLLGGKHDEIRDMMDKYYAATSVQTNVSGRQSTIRPPFPYVTVDLDKGFIENVPSHYPHLPDRCRNVLEDELYLILKSHLVDLDLLQHKPFKVSTLESSLSGLVRDCCPSVLGLHDIVQTPSSPMYKRRGGMPIPMVVETEGDIDDCHSEHSDTPATADAARVQETDLDTINMQKKRTKVHWTQSQIESSWQTQMEARVLAPENEEDSIAIYESDISDRECEVYIRTAFMRFFVTSLKHYRECITRVEEEFYFDEKLFTRHEVDGSSKAFFSSFFRTKMFGAFLKEIIASPGDCKTLFDAFIQSQSTMDTRSPSL